MMQQQQQRVVNNKRSQFNSSPKELPMTPKRRYYDEGGSGTPSSSARQSRNDRISIDGRSPVEQPAALSGESRKSSPPTAASDAKPIKNKLTDEMLRLVDKDMANSVSDTLGLSDEEERKHLAKMRRHSIFLDNSVMQNVHMTEIARQLSEVKKALRDSMINRIEHIDQVITDLNNVTDVDSTSIPISLEVFNNNMSDRVAGSSTSERKHISNHHHT